MTDLWTPNQTPTPCRCVNLYAVRRSDGSLKCGTCGHPYSPEMLAWIADGPTVLAPHHMLTVAQR